MKSDFLPPFGYQIETMVPKKLQFLQESEKEVSGSLVPTKWPRSSQRPRRSLAKVAGLCKDQKLGEGRQKCRPSLERFRAGEKCWEEPQELRNLSGVSSRWTCGE